MKFSLLSLLAFVTACCIFLGVTRFQTWETNGNGRYYGMDFYWPWRSWVNTCSGEVDVGVWVPWDTMDNPLQINSPTNHWYVWRDIVDFNNSKQR